jgi:putative flippase GtrA
MVRQKDFYKQVFFFGIVGIITVLIDLVVTVFLYDVVGLSAFFSSSIGFLSGFFFNFPMNRKKVFRHTEFDRFSLKNQAVLYTILCVFNLFMTGFMADLLVSKEILDISTAKLFTTGVIAVWNFIIFKFVIFSKNKNVQKL